LKISKNLSNHITTDKNLIQKRFFSYGYALDSLGKFLTKIKNSKLAKNTIVVITADNNTIDGNMKYDKNAVFNSKNIPFYLYLPPQLKKNLKIDSLVFGSHKDIFPTLYNIVLSDTKYISIGIDMLDKNSTHIGVNGSKVVISNNGVFRVTNLDKKSKNYEINYYRSILAITQYLLGKYD
jgi:phosphoglycerol transferase MdoB-like AlkP superfamily enzyme